MTDPWWRQAIVYEIYVRSFADGNGDGIGDLTGAAAKLAHLARLGVDAVWLTPFYPSPMADGGYDVADPMDVDPLFGDLAAFDDFAAQAHRLGLRVIVDIVPNHTSSEHPWFRAAIASPASPMRARYVFRDPPANGGLPNNWPSNFGGPAWSTEPAGEQLYLNLFAPEQPDLDWRNPDVADYYLRVLKFWLDRGVDGFRIDVAHGLVKQADLADIPSDIVDPTGLVGLPMWDQPEVHEIYASWRELLDSYAGDRMLVGEVYLYDQEVVAGYVGAGGLHQSFDLSLQLQPFSAEAIGATVLTALHSLAPRGALPTWVLDNHDLVRAATRYGGGVAGRERALAMMGVILGLPGSPYIYQGSELAAEQVLVPPELRQDPIWERSDHTREGRDGCRTPIAWTGERPGFGFTTSTSGWLPFSTDAEKVNVETQQRDEASPWSKIAALAAIRRTWLIDLADTVEKLQAPEGVLLLERAGGLLIALNTNDESVVVLTTGLLIGATGVASLEDGKLTLSPRSSAWVRLGRARPARPV